MKHDIRLLWPPWQASPNARLHPARRAGPLRKYREACWAATLEAALRAPTVGRIPLQIMLYPPDRRRRDVDNMLAALKHGLDGVAQAMRCDDSRFDPVPILCDPDPRGLGYVVVTVVLP